jgi:hypothetical protein
MNGLSQFNLKDETFQVWMPQNCTETKSIKMVVLKDIIFENSFIQGSLLVVLELDQVMGSSNVCSP